MKPGFRSGVLFVIVSAFSLACMGETTVGFSLGSGFRMSAPEIVTNGIPSTWSVCVTNAMETTSRIDVAAEVVAIGYDGDLISEIFRSATTNMLEPGESRLIVFSLYSDWKPSSPNDFDLIEFSTGISLRDVNRFSANWIRAAYVGGTNVANTVE